MDKLVQGMKAFWQDEEGVTAIEYGLIAALIAVAIIATVSAVGDSLNATFEKVSGALDDAGTGTGSGTGSGSGG